MRYNKILAAKFIARPNRFIAYVQLNGEEVICHVKNTGRCKELLVPGCDIYLAESDNLQRKTKYDLVAVNKNGELYNMDSYAPNIAAGEYLKQKYPFAKIYPERKFGNSRFDFYIEDGDDKIILEVKGVTLEKDGVALFPDAPTERGVKHIRELTEYSEKGYKTQILFVIQTANINSFSPNDDTHKEFGDALRNAKEKGVTVTAVNCTVTPDSMKIKDEVKVVLKNKQ